MDLDELQSVQSRERQTDSLQQLRETFYRDAGEYIQGLRAERERAAERADDPWNDPEISRLSDDIETAEGTVEAIYERRVGKIVKMASLAAADVPTEDDGLTDEERQLFDSLVSEIERSRDRVEAILDGQSPPSVPGGGDGTAADLSVADPGSTADPGPGPDADTDTDTAPDSHPDGADRSTGPGGSSGDPGRRPGDVDAASLMGETGPGPSGESTDSRREPPPEHPPDPDGDRSGGDDHRGSTRDRDDGRAPQSDRNADGGPAAAPGPGRAGHAGTDGPSRDSDGGGGTARHTQPESAPGRTAGTDGGESGGTAPSGSDDHGTAPYDGGERGEAPEDARATGRTGSAGETRPGDQPGGDGRTGESGSGGGETAGDSPELDRSTVKITADVGEIFGVEGRSYDLSASDVVTLPEANVEPLVERGAAERLD